ncbi:MAG: hypothetical protein EZS28_015817 [Streblomastix strix]|uniref:Uncharacterized protein n=1 Tax=Streblomastix strix TaxID=222440 RepID=A0A5J4W298_9EUKA|nr:MAG: hypothetical protein EZS28_015817 [Streblomastix strix]
MRVQQSSDLRDYPNNLQNSVINLNQTKLSHIDQIELMVMIILKYMQIRYLKVKVYMMSSLKNEEWSGRLLDTLECGEMNGEQFGRVGQLNPLNPFEITAGVGIGLSNEFAPLVQLIQSDIERWNNKELEQKKKVEFINLISRCVRGYTHWTDPLRHRPFDPISNRAKQVAFMWIRFGRQTIEKPNYEDIDNQFNQQQMNETNKNEQGNGITDNEKKDKEKEEVKDSNKDKKGIDKKDSKGADQQQAQLLIQQQQQQLLLLLSSSSSSHAQIQHHHHHDHLVECPTNIQGTERYNEIQQKRQEEYKIRREIRKQEQDYSSDMRDVNITAFSKDKWNESELNNEEEITVQSPDSKLNPPHPLRVSLGRGLLSPFHANLLRLQFRTISRTGICSFPQFIRVVLDTFKGQQLQVNKKGTSYPSTQTVMNFLFPPIWNKVNKQVIENMRSNLCTNKFCSRITVEGERGIDEIQDEQLNIQQQKQKDMELYNKLKEQEKEQEQQKKVYENDDLNEYKNEADVDQQGDKEKEKEFDREQLVYEMDPQYTEHSGNLPDYDIHSLDDMLAYARLLSRWTDANGRLSRRRFASIPIPYEEEIWQLYREKEREDFNSAFQVALALSKLVPSHLNSSQIAISLLAPELRIDQSTAPEGNDVEWHEELQRIYEENELDNQDITDPIDIKFTQHNKQRRKSDTLQEVEEHNETENERKQQRANSRLKMKKSSVIKAQYEEDVAKYADIIKMMRMKFKDSLVALQGFEYNYNEIKITHTPQQEIQIYSDAVLKPRAIVYPGGNNLFNIEQFQDVISPSRIDPEQYLDQSSSQYLSSLNIEHDEIDRINSQTSLTQYNQKINEVQQQQQEQLQDGKSSPTGFLMNQSASTLKLYNELEKDPQFKNKKKSDIFSLVIQLKEQKKQQQKQQTIQKYLQVSSSKSSLTDGSTPSSPTSYNRSQQKAEQQSKLIQQMLLKVQEEKRTIISNKARGKSSRFLYEHRILLPSIPQTQGMQLKMLLFDLFSAPTPAPRWEMDLDEKEKQRIKKENELKEKLERENIEKEEKEKELKKLDQSNENSGSGSEEEGKHHQTTKVTVQKRRQSFLLKKEKENQSKDNPFSNNYQQPPSSQPSNKNSTNTSEYERGITPSQQLSTAKFQTKAQNEFAMGFMNNENLKMMIDPFVLIAYMCADVNRYEGMEYQKIHASKKHFIAVRHFIDCVTADLKDSQERLKMMD